MRFRLSATVVLVGGLLAGVSGTAGAQSACTIVGTPGDDVIYGTDGPDVICALGGNDAIDGLGGDDLIYGGPGNDTIDAGAGNDRVFGLDGNDTIAGGPGDDQLGGGNGEDKIDGDDGDDTIFGDDGADVIEGGPGNDLIFGGAGRDVVAGDAGDDVVYGGAGDDVLVGSLDRIAGDIGADRFIGGDGDDELAGGFLSGQGGAAWYEPLPSDGGVFIGGAGVDRIFGTLGDDALYVGRDGGTASGLAGDDLLVGSGDATAQVRSVFCADTSVAELVAAGERIPVFGDGAFAATNLLIGGDGDDVFASGGGRSCMVGSQGSDLFYGSPLADSIWTGGDVRELGAFPWPGGETTDRDVVFAKAGDDAVWGSLGDELVWGSLGDDSFVADPRVRFAEPTDDVGGAVYLSWGDDLLVGGFGDDYLDGDFGSDRIFGGPGDDDTWPGDDDEFDFTDGGAGEDICTRFVPDRAIACETVYDRPFEN